MITVGIMLLLLTASMACLSTQTATAKSKALKAYSEFLAENENLYGSFSVIYLDKNSVPELFVGERTFNAVYLFTYSGGDVKKVGGTGKIASHYYKKKNVLITGWRYSAGPSGESATAYYRMKDGEIKLALADVKITSYKNGALENTGEYRTYQENGMDYSTVNKKAFSSALKKLVGNKKKTKIKYYENKAAKRKKYLK